MSFSSEENNAVKKELSKFSQGTTYYLIRHGEKDRSAPGDDPDLTEKGQERARNWAKVLEDVPLDLIYSTDFKRTQQTVQVIAENKHLDIKLYDHHHLYNEDFQKATIGKQVLVAGHNTTTAQFANKILQQEKYDQIDYNENGALFVVNISPSGKRTSNVFYIN